MTDIGNWYGTPYPIGPKKLINTHLQDYKFTSLIEGLTETIKYYENRGSSSK